MGIYRIHLFDFISFFAKAFNSDDPNLKGNAMIELLIAMIKRNAKFFLKFKIFKFYLIILEILKFSSVTNLTFY